MSTKQTPKMMKPKPDVVFKLIGKLEKLRSVASERELETITCDAIKALGGKALKFHSQYDTGWMDRWVLIPSYGVIFAEFKKPKTGALSARQELNRDWLAFHGFNHWLLDTKEICILFISIMLKHVSELYWCNVAPISEKVFWETVLRNTQLIIGKYYNLLH